jgi:penicillin amidase
VTSEVARARVACAAGLSADTLRKRLEPPHTTVIPAGLDPCVVTPEVLKDYVLGTEPAAFSPTLVKVAAMDLSEFSRNAAEEGSNNWVVAPSHSATGRPIMANDPHRTLGVPSLRYIVHLSAPGMSIIGAGEPALPGVSIGHNDSGAFGLTIFGIDQEDLYVYALNPANPDQYRYGDGWEAMTVVREAIPVKGEAPREVELRFTRHGPVLQYDPVHARAFALRSVWGQPGASGYFQSTWLTHAKTWADFQTAHDHWGAPPQNLVWADVSGAIGWAGSGLAPIRPNWDGLMPVPGDGRYEWRGFRKGSELPSVLDPGKGWFATANEMNLPPDYPDETRKVSFEWGDRSRIDRIDQVLSADAKVSVADSMALQTDSHSAISYRLTALAAPLASTDPRVAEALARLKSWDHDETLGSVAASIYEVWAVKHLGPAVLDRLAPAARASFGTPALDAILTALEHPSPWFGPDPEGARNAVLLISLAAALDELGARLGPDMNGWAWGRLHHATWSPAIGSLADPATRAAMTLGPLPIPGGASTPKAATYSPSDFNVISGASVRIVVDVGAWDNSMMINSPGQSGDVASDHYRDLFPLWASGRYAPLLYTRAAIDDAAESVTDPHARLAHARPTRASQDWVIPPVLHRPYVALARSLPSRLGMLALRALNRLARLTGRRFRRATSFGAVMSCDPVDILDARILHFGIWEPRITQLISTLLAPGDIFIDVGANIGYYSLLASKIVGASGVVIAVEAAPDMFQMLAGNIELNGIGNIRAINVAASDRAGRQPIYKLSDINRGAATTLPDRGGSILAEVEARRFDDILEDVDLGRVKLIKIDIEGAEAPVLRVILTMLDRLPPNLRLIVEMSAGGEDDVTTFARLLGAGFSAYLIENRYDLGWYLHYEPDSPLIPIEALPSGLCDILFERHGAKSSRRSGAGLE